MLIRRSFRTISPWQEMENFRRLANTINSPGIRVRPSFPAMNIWANQDGAIVEVKLPGVNPEDIDISIEGQTVTIAGSHPQKAFDDGEKYLRRERRFGNFSRSFELPFTIEADKVEATFKNGILSIALPQAEADKPKKIAVQSA